MPRTTTDEVRALTSQRNVPFDEVDDIDRVADLLALIEGTAPESSQISLLRLISVKRFMGIRVSRPLLFLEGNERVLPDSGEL